MFIPGHAYQLLLKSVYIRQTQTEPRTISTFFETRCTY